MQKEEMMTLIKAWTGFMKLNDIFVQIDKTCNLDGDDYQGLWSIYDVIKNHSKYADLNDDTNVNIFYEILSNKDFNLEQKYTLLTH